MKHVKYLPIPFLFILGTFLLQGLFSYNNVANAQSPFYSYVNNRSLVILIGINKYPFGTPLTGAEDVRLALAQWLIPFGINNSQVSVWVAADKERLQDLVQENKTLIPRFVEPNKREILKLIDDASKDTRYNQLLIFFCGHGFRDKGVSYLVPCDGNIQDISQSNINLKTEVFSKLEKSTATNKLLIIDACRENITTNDTSKEDFISEFESMTANTNKYSFGVITSCSKGEVAQEKQSNEKTNNGNGLFMWHFINGLTGKADMMAHFDGKTNLVEAYNYARAKVSLETQSVSYDFIQTPELFSNNIKASKIILSSGEWVKKQENETPWNFLYRIAVTMAKNESTNANYFRSKSINILTNLLNLTPSNFDCYSVRSGIYRKAELYSAALSDARKIGATLDVYAKGSGYQYNPTKQQYELNKVSVYSTPTVSAKPVVKLENNDLISLEEETNGWFKIDTINNRKVDKELWIERKSINWTTQLAEERIAPSQMNNHSYSGPAGFSPSVAPDSSSGTSYSTGGVTF